MATQAIAPAQKKDIRQLLQSEAVRNQIALVLPKHLTPDRMARVALTAILKTPKLADCKPESLLQALMLCSQAGLEPDGRNAHLIPFGDQVQVIFDWKGLVSLAERNGVQSIYADKVCENDEFDAWVEEGEKKLKHRVNWKQPRGKAYAYYCSCRRNDRLDYEVMTRDEVDAIRARSRAGQSGPWVTDYDEMAKKTVIRRMSKRWDLSSEIAEVINEDYDVPSDIVKVKKPEFLVLPDAPAYEAPATAPAASTAAAPQPAAESVKAPETGKGDAGLSAAAGSVPADDGDLGPAESQPAMTAEVLTLATDLATFAKAEGEDDEAAYKRMITLTRTLLEKAGVTEGQLLAQGRKDKWVKDAQRSIGDLAASKLVNVGKAFPAMLPELRKQKA